MCRARRCRSESRSQYLESPPYNSDGSDDAGSRQGALQDMDLHCFHPVFFTTTPRGRYVIPQRVSNFGFAERKGIEVRPALTPAHGPR
jgi:hypothetical protein